MAVTRENKSDQNILLPDAHLVRKSALVFRALNHGLRQKILQLLAEKGRMTVTELYELLYLEQSVVSQHLAILRRAGFVSTQKEGKFVWYRLQETRMTQIESVIHILMQ